MRDKRKEEAGGVYVCMSSYVHVRECNCGN